MHAYVYTHIHIFICLSFKWWTFVLSLPFEHSDSCREAFLWTHLSISPSCVPKSRTVSSAVTPCPALVRRRAAHTLQLNVRVWFPFFFHHVLLSAFFVRVLWWARRPVIPSVIPLMANDGEHLFLCLLLFIFLLWRNSRFYKFCSLTSECS